MDADGWTWFAPSATHGAILRADPISCLQHVGRKQCVNSLMLMPRCEKPWEKIKLSHELRHMMATCLWHTIFRFWSCSVQGGLVSEQFLSESWVVLLLVPWMQTRLMLQCDLHTTVFFSQRFPLWPTKAIPSSVCPKVSIWSTEIGCTSVWFRRKSWDLFDRLWLLWAPKSIEIRCLQWAQLSHWGTRGYTPGGCCCLCCSWSRESRGSDEVWVACFLKSCRDGQPRDHIAMDLIVVLDVSGSMTLGEFGLWYTMPVLCYTGLNNRRSLYTYFILFLSFLALQHAKWIKMIWGHRVVMLQYRFIPLLSQFLFGSHEKPTLSGTGLWIASDFERLKIPDWPWQRKHWPPWFQDCD